MNFTRKILLFGLFAASCLCSREGVNGNQTADTTPIIPGSSLPFTVAIEQASFSLPNGIHSGASAIYKGYWFFIAGRTNGLHGFNPGNNNFPPSQQNTVAYVVDPYTGTTWSRALNDPTSGFDQYQIDILSVTSPQFYQTEDRLYISGGYGVDTSTGLFGTKNTLTAIDLKGFIEWVKAPVPGQNAVQYTRQVTNSVFQVTGGYMARSKKNLSLLVFGQNFTGFYHDDSNGDYIQQVQRFRIRDNGKKLSVKVLKSHPKKQDPNYRRRDLNVVPVMHKLYGVSVPAYIAYSGVFTLDGGIWTVPVLVSHDGKPSMDNPNDPGTFKQGMNNYASPTFGLYAEEDGDMYVVFFGGLSYGYFQGGVFQTDTEVPFINQVTTVRLNKKGSYTQYLMSNEYPVIPSTGSNPGNPLLFGAGAAFMPADGLPTYDNGVLKYDNINKNKSKVIGYIVGGIMSTLPNTNSNSDSAASPYVFKVTLTPQ